MADLPTGTATFLFTDVEGSTRPREQDPAVMRVASARHDALVALRVRTLAGPTDAPSDLSEAHHG